MRGFVDLHCHYLPSIDDGVRSEDDGVALLRALGEVGFAHVVATPHIRPGMFDNRAEPLREVYARMRARLDGETGLPETSLAAEHYFDEVVFGLLMRGEGLPYGTGRTALLEFHQDSLPLQLAARLFDLRRRRLRPVIAHPERYAPFWSDPAKQAEAMRRAGGVLLLDVMSLEGRYGERAQRTAERLLDDDAYYAACSDAHRPADAEVVGKAIARLEALVGVDAARTLLTERPRSVIDGKIFDEAYD